jgi:hypothetical protein
LVTALELRVVGKKIHCVRFKAQAAKLGQGKTVASFRADVEEIPDGVVSALSSKEYKQLEAWFEVWRGLREKALLSEARIAAGGWVLEDLARAVEDHGGLTGKQADALWMGVTRVAKALRKAGFPKPKRAARAQKIPGQLDLLDESQ